MEYRNIEYRKDLNAPACRFGPGGDFISDWPGNSVPMPPPEIEKVNALAHVLEALSRIVGVSDRPLPQYKPQLRITFTNSAEGQTIGSGPAFKSPAYTSAASAFKGNSLNAGQATLFSNDSGTGLSIAGKQNYRVRASRRTSRKRIRPGIAEQGSLFEAYYPRAKTA